MRRSLTYVGSQVYEWYDSAQAQNNMTALAKACAAAFGTGGSANGLSCAPTTVPSMAVTIGPGEIYQMEPLEATPAGTLPADTAHTILKQGIQLGSVNTSTMAAPGTTGQSINYLIQAQYQDSDISLDPTTGSNPVVLQFYNASNPSTPWSGPNNSGSVSNTFRDGVVALQVLAGIAAATGTQTTPNPTTGWIPLWVVTVAFGQTSITAPNISQHPSAPFISLTTGRYLGTQVFTANGTYTPGTYLLGGQSVTARVGRIRGAAGGGAGGGTAATSGSTAAAALGGGAGSTGEVIQVGLSSQTVTIGAGGVAASGAAGGDGGSTSIGSWLVLPGGKGGSLASAVTPPSALPPQVGSASSPTSTATSVLYLSNGALPLSPAIALSTSSVASGAGANSPYGGGGGGQGGTTAGGAANGHGAGGGGASAGASSAAQAGGAGTPGILFIDEYA